VPPKADATDAPPAGRGRAGGAACPRCGEALPVRGERGACPACGLAVRFVDAPERPCAACGKALPLPPGQESVRCTACGAWQATDPTRRLVARATCPRCGREVDVPLQGDRAPCPRCGAVLELGPARRDTL
jgi:LSD1 subclass zinc finger protein